MAALIYLNKLLCQYYTSLSAEAILQQTVTSQVVYPNIQFSVMITQPLHMHNRTVQFVKPLASSGRNHSTKMANSLQVQSQLTSIAILT